MTLMGWAQVLVFFGLLVAMTPLLGGYMARLFSGEPVLLSRALAGWLLLYVILRTQTIHPFNPQGYHSAPWNVTFNTVTSSLTNTNWQYYSGETTLSYFSQMAGLTVQNFASAAAGITVAVALISVARDDAGCRRRDSNPRHADYDSG